MTDVYDIRKGVPVHPSNKPKTGLTKTLRLMDNGDSIVVPNSKRGSVYSCAAQAGIKVQTQSNPDGLTTTVWRVDEGTTSDSTLALEYDTGSTRQSLLTADGEFPSGEYHQEHPYGPTVWRADCDEQGRPINRFKKKAPEPKPVPAPPAEPTAAEPGPVAQDPTPTPRSKTPADEYRQYYPQGPSIFSIDLDSQPDLAAAKLRSVTPAAAKPRLVAPDETEAERARKIAEFLS